MKVDIKKVDWMHDEETQGYIRENAERLKDTDAMTPEELAEAICYCESVYNPYSDELLDRAGYFGYFNMGESYEESCEVLRMAAGTIGIILV